MAHLAKAVLLIVFPLLASACGTGTQTREEPFGKGAGEVWVFRPAHDPPRSVVVFVHGHGGPGEDTPQYHLPWLRHLVAGGNAVLYPRYELYPGAHGTVGHIVDAVRTGMDALGRPDVPVVGIGYSRGGRLVMDWAARAADTALAPRALLSVFPASGEDPEEDLSRIARRTPILVLVGDRDEVVGNLGARLLARELEAAGSVPANVGVELIRSHDGFVASHLSVLEDSPGARSAFWDRADGLIGIVAPR
jgi:pimeloyl-ACP methyl ester carboxylesterase